ncbi:MAG TPA: hypothetical protein VK034_07265 [Enhygromyxa sp.]|nr:hypothetical protein [Enhygromyxa sp.]
MYRIALTISSCVLALGLAACDKGDKSAEAKTEAKQDDTKKEEAAKQDDKPAPVAAEPSEAPAPDDTKGIGGVIHAAAGDEPPAADPGAPTPTEPPPSPAEPPPSPAEPAPAEPPPADAPHFDTSKDKGGMIGHLAGSLVHDDGLADAKHAVATLASLVVGDTTPSDAELCGHVWKAVFVTEFGDIADAKMEADFMQMCKLEIEKERLKLGPDVFAEAAACIMAAQTMAAIELCDRAEQEAEQELHEKPHGDGLDKKTCEAAVDHMFALLRKDLGDDKDLLALLEGDLANLQADAVQMCMDEATRAEIDCLMKAQDLAGLDACER